MVYAQQNRTFHYSFEGTIQNKIPIIAHLSCFKGDIWGSYSYVKYGKPIYLHGKIDNLNKLVIKEETESAGIFTGSFENNNFAGRWENASKNKNLDFQLRKKTSENSIELSPLCYSEQRNIKVNKDSIQADYNYCILVPESGNNLREISQTIANVLFNSSSPDDLCSIKLKSLATDFFDDFQNSIFHLDDEFTPHTDWSFEKKVSVISNTSEYLYFKISWYEYAGGAHGNYGKDFLVIDKKTGKKVEIDQVINDNENKLSETISNRLLQNMDTDSTSTLEENGFYTDMIDPTSNFYLTNTGIGFYYNTYEIAPYAMGPFNIFLNFEEIKDYLKEGIQLSSN